MPRCNFSRSNEIVSKRGVKLPSAPKMLTKNSVLVGLFWLLRSRLLPTPLLAAAAGSDTGGPTAGSDNVDVDSNDDYYAILGLHPHATPKEIKRAYRRLALGPGVDRDVPKEDEEKIDRVGQAYEVLADPEKRNVYDKNGKRGLEEMERQQEESSAGTEF